VRKNYRTIALLNHRVLAGRLSFKTSPYKLTIVVNSGPKTIFEKIWDAHVVKRAEGYPDALFIDRHFIHEVTSPQAFDGLRKRGIKVFNTSRTTATADHNVPTKDQHLPIKEALSRHQVETLRKNCKDFDIELYDLGHPYQGIVHIIGPELGLTLPGMTIVCGDSHTSTHGAFGNIAFGIGTSVSYTMHFAIQTQDHED